MPNAPTVTEPVSLSGYRGQRSIDSEGHVHSRIKVTFSVKGPSSHLQFKSLLVCNALSALLRAWNVLISAGSPLSYSFIAGRHSGRALQPRSALPPE
jgi:hypothetical protein